MALLEQIAEQLIKGKANDVRELVNKALAEKINPGDILNKGLIAGMGVVGERFKNNEIYVPEVLIAARAMKAGSEILKPLLAASGIQPRGRVVIGTVKGDLHDIGKNLVAMMMEGAGFQVIDQGVDVSVEKFINAARDNKAEVIAASALLTTTMTGMKDLVEAVRASDIGDAVKVLVGGAPVTQAYCDEIGADGYAADAASAADLAKSLIKAR
jgi:5-methyltetrahydrofolate--homocysteine methyltransferase